MALKFCYYWIDFSNEFKYHVFTKALAKPWKWSKIALKTLNKIVAVSETWVSTLQLSFLFCEHHTAIVNIYLNRSCINTNEQQKNRMTNKQTNRMTKTVQTNRQTNVQTYNRYTHDKRGLLYPIFDIRHSLQRYLVRDGTQVGQS